MKFQLLSDWLIWIKSLHFKEIDLSLARVAMVAERLQIKKPSGSIITVAGTNGKGSCVAGLEAIYLAAGYRVGAFTSPYLFHYNEQVRIQGEAVKDALFCEAFEQIRIAANEVTLTQFEYGTLAALLIFQQANLDVWVLEVGLGGRLDAVNIMDADVAIVTSIALDHMDWLGDTREAIAREKAGIFRANQPAICGDFDPPKSLLEYAAIQKTPIYCQGTDFGFEAEDSEWNWWSQKQDLHHLPIAQLGLQNMSTVLMAIQLLQQKLPVTQQAIHQAMAKVTLPGRLQVISGAITRIYDVSHNPAAVQWLVNYLVKNPIAGKTRAVFSMLSDKDIYSTILTIQNFITHWYIAPLEVDRGASGELLISCFERAKLNNKTAYLSIEEAKKAAMNDSIDGDRIVVFGSFHTVASDLHR